MTVSERLAEALGLSAFLGFPAQPAHRPQPHAEQGLRKKLCLYNTLHQRFLEMTFATFPRYRCLFKAGKADRGKKEGACLIWKKDAGK